MNELASSPPVSDRRLLGRLLGRISHLNRAHHLLEPGDRVLVACSGGKDSWAMLHLLRAYEAMVPFSFSLVAVTVDQGHPGFPAERVRAHFRAEGFEHHIEVQDTHRVVVERTPAGKIHCSLCSRMRRGILHRVAGELGANKIALGHHRNDVAETLLLNMLFSGRVGTFGPILPPVGPPELRGAAVIRPLWTCAEENLATYASSTGAPIIPCQLCGSQPDARRPMIKRWLADLTRDHPDVWGNLLACSGHVPEAARGTSPRVLPLAK